MSVQYLLTVVCGTHSSHGLNTLFTASEWHAGIGCIHPLVAHLHTWERYQEITLCSMSCAESHFSVYTGTFMRVDTAYLVCFTIITACLLNWKTTHESQSEFFVRKGNSLGNYCIALSSMKYECLPQVWSPQQLVFTNTALLLLQLGTIRGFGKHFSVRVRLLHVHR